jgi:DNA-binding response OmpR family regulator
VRHLKRRLLCVDDDIETTEMLTYLLRGQDYDVDTAMTVEDALHLAKRESFNLYIFDHWFNRGSGIELCRKIREFDPHTPIIFYSGSALDSDRQEAMYIGATAFVEKPGIDELIKTVHKILVDRQDC